MKPFETVALSDRQKGDAWSVDVAMIGAPQVPYLIVIDASTGKALISEPVPTIAQINEILEQSFKTFGPPAVLLTDGTREFSDDSFRSLMASFGVQHVVHFAGALSRSAAERFARAVNRDSKFRLK